MKVSFFRNTEIPWFRHSWKGKTVVMSLRKHLSSNRKGFTMAELLIVVAIIAVLIAIAIPIINKQLEKSREAYDIATMRQAASAAIELYYAGVTDSASASKAGLKWWTGGDKDSYNAAGAYDPGSGRFYPTREELTKKTSVKAYGKGTALDGGTTFIMGNPKGAYAPKEDYTKAVVMVSIYPNASPAYAYVYWKNNVDNTTYVGGQEKTNVPNYSIRIPLG